MARYSATSNPPWEEKYNEKIHNFIVFSYDGGKTWGPFTNGVTDLETGVGGIRIKGRVEIDEAAVSYELVPSQSEILRYINDEETEVSFSPGVLDFRLQREYLNLVDNSTFIENFDNLETDENGELIIPENTFVPYLSCDLISHITGITIPLNPIIQTIEEENPDRKVLKCYYGTGGSYYSLDFEYLYEYSKSKLLTNQRR
jgi:hypothetical protein